MRVTLRACVVILLSPSHPPLPYKAPSCALHYELVWSSFSHPVTLPFPTRHPHARYITSLCGHPSLIQPPSPSLQGTLMRVTLRACVVILLSSSHPPLPYKAPSFPTRHPHARYITSLCGHPSLIQPPSPSLQGTLMRVTLRACVVILPITILLSLHTQVLLS